ncbi:F-box protein CPR1-like [Cornus florida]|uniref:F-box protein CPR1-like n=1 Tax=Cornus florida TaxID=4283 RepID=UPI00289EB9DD|nr:F-box protein CPR1-like [Cornus florida]
MGKGNREKQLVAFPMSELPENLFEDILTRLQVKDLLRSRCVSKQWCALIDSPIFIKLQLNRSLETVKNLCLIFVLGNRIISVDVGILDVVPPLDVEEVDNPIKYDCHSTFIQGSCNGLICLQWHPLGPNFYGDAIALFNPWTKEYRILPPVPPHKRGVKKYHGIVYDPVGDDYKVVRIVQFVDESKTLFK